VVCVSLSEVSSAAVVWRERPGSCLLIAWRSIAKAGR
jgi:hypothetical protein